MRFGSSLTSRNFPNETRSRARRANVTPILGTRSPRPAGRTRRRTKRWARRSGTRARPGTRSETQGTSRQTRLGRSIARAMRPLDRCTGLRGGRRVLVAARIRRGPPGCKVYAGRNAASAVRPCRAGRPPLLELDGGAGPLELGLCLLGVFLRRLLEHGLGCAVHEGLGLLETEAGERTHLLDDLNLLVAGRDQDDVELVLLLGGGLAGSASGCRGGGRSHRSGCSDAELLLERLEEVVELENGHVLEDVEQIRGAHRGHGGWSPVLIANACE